MISFWRSYGVAAAWAIVLLPVALAAYLFGSNVLDGYGWPSTEDLAWYVAFAVILILPAMAVIHLLVSPAWIWWRRDKARSVAALGAQASAAGTVAALVVCFSYLAVS
ncbi:hypothetical protein [Actinoplanes sp. N902-109]|uniref:hypothetical protein n=1 Tax=Actinoplanes sp. (strain N902-109) TaxID=649831 RepID=UPI0003295803|nr:hypothetical protein [Actinoplanes sp. N902-109]AGL13577.1 hypothetical protein L083_0067 [Actinoplanes sp. N902-109]